MRKLRLKPGVSGGLSSSEALWLCPLCKVAPQFGCPHSSTVFCLTLGPNREGLSELPFDSNTEAQRSCPKGPIRWSGVGYRVMSHETTLGYLGQVPSYLVSQFTHLYDEGVGLDPQGPSLSTIYDSRPERRPWDFFTCPGLVVGLWGAAGDPGSNEPLPAGTPHACHFCHVLSLV